MAIDPIGHTITLLLAFQRGEKFTQKDVAKKLDISLPAAQNLIDTFSCKLPIIECGTVRQGRSGREAILYDLMINYRKKQILELIEKAWPKVDKKYLQYALGDL